MEFREEEAIEYGVNEAIMISNFRYWITKNKANGKHEHEGRTWKYNSRKAFSEIFKFWSDEQIKRILNSLVSKNIIQKGNFNKAGFDRTKWYSFVDEEKFLSICQNQPMDWVKSTNGLGEINQPIPNSIPNSIPNNINKKKQKKEFVKPTIEEIKTYCEERKNNIDAETFFDFYESKGWVVGKSSMKDWKAAIRTWERNRKKDTAIKPKESKSIYKSYEEILADEKETQKRIKIIEKYGWDAVKDGKILDKYKSEAEQLVAEDLEENEFKVEGLEDW